jgi:signal transduction histidine kinase
VTFGLDFQSFVGPVPARRDRYGGSLRGALLTAAFYYLGAQAAFLIGTFTDQALALFWPPNVILFCILLLVPERRWWIYVLAVLPAHVLAEAGVGMSPAPMVAAFVSNTAVAILNAYAVRNFLGEPPWLGSFQKACAYIVLIGFITPGFVAFGGACVPLLGGRGADEFWTFYAHWFLANAILNLTLRPFLLCWFPEFRRWRHWVPLRKHVEPTIITIVLIAVCFSSAYAAGAIVGSNFLSVFLLLPLPFVLWAAARYGGKGASGTVLIVAVILIWRTLHHHAGFENGSPERALLALQVFLTGLAIPILLLGASIDELRRAETSMRGLAATLLRAQDDERRRIARDLHDSTGQNLVAATLIAAQIQRLLPPAGEALARKLDDVLQASITEIRTVSYLLHPPLLDEAGLGLALREYVQGYVERSGIDVELRVAADVDRLRDDIELILFRVVQEALANVARHSKSPIAIIDLNRVRHSTGECIVLSIEDAGQGMVAAGSQGRGLQRPPMLSNASRGVGLASMSERVRQAGGRIAIETASGGTIVTATIPLPSP